MAEDVMVLFATLWYEEDVMVWWRKLWHGGGCYGMAEDVMV